MYSTGRTVIHDVERDLLATAEFFVAMDIKIRRVVSFVSVQCGTMQLKLTFISHVIYS